MTAFRNLKPGGTLVYSTCTFAPEENEANVEWILKKSSGRLRLDKIHLPGIQTYPCLTEWNKKSFSDEIDSAARIFPDQDCMGFFIAKFVLE